MPFINTCNPMTFQYNVGIGTDTNLVQTLTLCGTNTRIESRAGGNTNAGAYYTVYNGASLVGQSSQFVDNAGNWILYTGTTSEAERLRVTAAGNVGIGTTSPSDNLHIAASEVGNVGIAIQNTNASYSSQIRFLNSAGGECSAITYVQSSNFLAINVNGGNRLNITSAGNVGIGTESPANLLHVNGTSQFNDTMNFSFGKISWGGSPSRLVVTSCGTYNLALATDNFTDRMTIQASTGNVGINVTAPSTKLHVCNPVNQAYSPTSFNSSLHALHIQFCDQDQRAGLIRWTSHGNLENTFGVVQIGCSNGGTGCGQGDFVFQAYRDPAAYSELMRLTRLGNVGIGTSSPSYKLHVNGTFYAAGSSIKYKEGICNYDTDSCLFMCLKPVTYQYKDEWQHLGRELKSQSQIGLIAEDVAEVMPELAVLVNEEDEKVVRNVDYEKLSVVLLKEVQKLRQEVDELKNNK